MKDEEGESAVLLARSSSDLERVAGMRLVTESRGEILA